MGKPEGLSGGQTENSNQKLLLDVARSPDSSQSVPFPTGGVENRADDSRRWDKSSFTHFYQILCQSAQSFAVQQAEPSLKRLEESNLLKSFSLPEISPDLVSLGVGKAPSNQIWQL